MAVRTRHSQSAGRAKLRDQLILSLPCQGWSGGAMVLGKLPVPGRPTNLDYGRARA